MEKPDLNQFKACKKAVVWYEDFKTPQEAWNACPRGDWMLWIAQKLGVNKRLLTLAKGRCAETVIHLMEDERSVKAVRVAIAYGKGEASEEELKGAAYDAFYTAAAAAYAYTAAYAAVRAADAAYDAFYVAAYAAAAAAYAADAREKNRKLTADICREILTKEVFEKLKLNHEN